MQFKIYDVLASLIPGLIVVSVAIPFYVFMTNNVELFEQKLGVYKDISGIITSVFLVGSYLVGYIIHAMGSWSEPILWFTWGGKPSENLFKNKSKRLQLVEVDTIFNFLKSKSSNEPLKDKTKEDFTKGDLRELFQLAKNIANQKSRDGIKERIAEFNNSYIFSRNVLISYLTSSILIAILVFQNIVHIWALIILIVFFLVLWYRCRDRAFYYSREILAGAYYSSLD